MKDNIIQLINNYMTDRFFNKWYTSNKSNIKDEYLEEYNKAVKIFEHALKYIKNETNKK